jgi:hypothetical protein
LDIHLDNERNTHKSNINSVVGYRRSQPSKTPNILQTNGGVCFGRENSSCAYPYFLDKINQVAYKAIEKVKAYDINVYEE